MATVAQSLSGNARDLPTRKERSLWGDAWRRLSRNRAAVAGLVVICSFILVAIFAKQIAPHNPVAQTGKNSLRPPAWVTGSTPARTGDWKHPLGTDNIGRDIYSRLIYGTRVSLIVGLVPTILVVIIGVGLGLFSGFTGGSVDNLLMRFTDIITAFPDLLFLITINVAFRETAIGKAFNGLFLIFLALSLVSWTGMARLVRGQVLSLKQKEFIESARAIGVPTSKILWTHLLPNTMAPVIVSVSFAIPAAILAEAVLTFLGVGMRVSIDQSNPFPTSLGVLMSEGFSNLSSGPWGLVFPTLCVAIIMISFTSLGDGLRDALDPRDQ